MKTRIMFVDDDPLLLASTRRQLLKKLPDCELVFFYRAIDALEDIAKTAPDIVLSDVCMPEMDGAEFLTHVAQIAPSTIRFAWTGQADSDQLGYVFKISHKVFSKPCPTERLKCLISTVADFCGKRASNCLPAMPDCLAKTKSHSVHEGLFSFDWSMLHGQFENFDDILIPDPNPSGG